METKSLVRCCAGAIGAAAIATGLLTACGGKGEEKAPSSTTPTTTTTTTPSTTAPAPAPAPAPSPTENAPNMPPGGNSFTPGPAGPQAPPYTTHRERQYPY
jgi:hypothetical protein